jgi:hypothetical protein
MSKLRVLKLLRESFVKQNKRLPLGVDAASLDMQAERIAKELADAGYRGPINLNIIKRIQDALRPTYETVTPRALADVMDMTGKKIDTSKGIMGGFEIGAKRAGMPADDYANLKEEWFGRIIANTDEDLNTFIKGFINKTDDRFTGLSQSQRKDFLNMVDDRLKLGNKKFMDTYTDEKGKFSKFPEDFAHGGRTGTGLNYLLGEDDQNVRVPFGGLGGFNAARRAFLKAMGAGAAGVGAAKSGLFGLLKSSKPISGVVTSSSN